MNYTIKSTSLTVSVSDCGAELQSILYNGREYLWQGDPAVWGGRAPVLFPFIGASKDGQYTHEGVTRKAQRHGFVRTACFHKVYQDEQKISLEYRDNAITRKDYPFAFTLTVTFSVTGDVLCVENTVENRGAGMMPFLMGAHEAYNCSPFEDGYIEFFPAAGAATENAPMESETVNLHSGLLTGERYAVPFTGNILPLDYSLFDKDTLVFRDVPCRKVALKSKSGNNVIEVAYDAPHLAVWTKPGAPYVCIEPWFGLPGYENESKELAQRPGVVCLGAGEVFVSRHSIKV